MAVKVTCSDCGKELWTGLTGTGDEADRLAGQQTLLDAKRVICSDCWLARARRNDPLPNARLCPLRLEFD